MMKNKKIIGIVLAVLAVLTGGFFGIRQYRNSNRKASAVPVEMLNQQFYSEGAQMYGNIYDADSQNIYLQPTSIIERVYVSEGQPVAKGDPLIAFDMTSQQLNTEIKQLEVETIRNNLAKAKQELIKLQNAKPYVEPAPEPEPEPEPEVTPEPEPEPDPVPGPVQEELRNDAWTALKRLDQKYETEDGLLHYLLTSDGLLYGSFFNELKAQPAGTMAVLEVRDGDVKDGTLISSWTLNSSFITADYDDRDCWFILTHDKAGGTGSAIINPSGTQPGGYQPGIWQPDTPAVTPSNTADEESYDGMYTKEELAEMIASKRNDIRDLDLSLRRAMLELKVMQESLDDGVIYAKKDGVVKTLGDPANPPQDGSPFMSVASGTGLTVRASVSELLLDQIQIGKPVTLTCFDTGDVFSGEVKSLDVYPSSSNIGGGGNPNASYYDFYVSCDEAPSLPAYAFLQVQLGSADAPTSIAIENAFVRRDASGSYVMKAEEGKLKKQYVKTGRSFYGYATEILEGLSVEDAITFPYGDGAVEGTSVEITDDMGVFYQ